MASTRSTGRSVILVAILTMVCVGVATADNPPREIIRGTKVVPAMVVAYDGHTSPMNKLATEISKAFTDLSLAAQDAGLHPVGPPTAMANFANAADGNIQWEAWLPIADQPRKEDLDPAAVVKVKKIAETRVAFTYHLGDFAMLENTFGSLVAWAQAQALELAGAARTAVQFMPAAGDKPAAIGIECQLELTPQGAK